MRTRSSGSLLGTIDLFMVWYVIVLAIGLGVLYKRRTQPIAIALFVVLRRHRGVHRPGQEQLRREQLSRKKKILIGVGVLIALGAIAFANLRFKRTEGVTVNTETVKKQNLEALVSASGKIQPTRSVNISADTQGRVTNLAVNEGDRVKRDQFLLQIDPRNLRTAVQRTEASLAAAKSQMEQLRLSLESARVAVKQAEENLKRQQELSKGGLTTRELLESSEHELKIRQADLRSQEQQVKTQELRMQQESATRGKRALRSEQGPHRIAHRRHRHPTQHRGGRNRRRRHDEQRRHGVAHHRRHVRDSG